MEKITSTKLITKACKELNLRYSYTSKDRVVISIHYPKFDHLIINFNLGINSSSHAHLCLDKAYQAEFLKEQINIPKTKSYLDPYGPYQNMVKIKSIKEVSENIVKNFSFPLVIKKNKGSEGNGVFLCNNKTELNKAVNYVFNHKNKDYDYVLLAQEYIKPKVEYRAIFYKQNLEILYRKDNKNSNFMGNLSPLHFKGSKAIDVTDKEIVKSIANFIKPIFNKINLKYAGFDIIEDENNRLWLIEINSSPTYGYYLKDNSEEKVVGLFKKIVKDLKS